MSTLKEKILSLLNQKPGLSDREITNVILGAEAPQQSINIACRSLESKGVIKRIRRKDGRIVNYLADMKFIPDISVKTETKINDDEYLSEDEIKHILHDYLKSVGWQTEIAWGKSQGIDIIATRGKEKWIIEAKGQGSRQPMRVNYFISMLGEVLQRMNDSNAKYSIALPDIAQFRNLWYRLPELAKKRTEITAIFVDKTGKVTEKE
jgi:hypothetical protein